jgi:alpha-galactosidase
MTSPSPQDQAALRPPMGFNPYNFMGGSADAAQIAGFADTMVAIGMRDAGYQYVIMDDGWQGDRASDGTLQPSDPFLSGYPDGMHGLADHIHGDGLKFGLYTSPSATTCDSHVGSADHVQQDVNTFATWGVDYIKLDWCGADGTPAGAQEIAAQWTAAIAATHRQIVLSINASLHDGTEAQSRPWEWGPGLVNMWRIGYDICQAWTSTNGQVSNNRCFPYTHGVDEVIEDPAVQQSNLGGAGVGHWSDLDMLEVGNSSGGLGLKEWATNFSIWAICAAPLIAGNDIRQMNGQDDASTVLLNRDVIAVDQDPLGYPGHRVAVEQGIELWTKKMAGGSLAIVLFNPTGADVSQFVLRWHDVGFPAGSTVVRDLWTHSQATVATDEFATTVASHGVVMLRLSPPSAQGKPLPSRGSHGAGTGGKTTMMTVVLLLAGLLCANLAVLGLIIRGLRRRTTRRRAQSHDRLPPNVALVSSIMTGSRASRTAALASAAPGPVAPIVQSSRPPSRLPRSRAARAIAATKMAHTVRRVS